jgi:mono/diheme cytochrome c family protein
MAAVNRGERKRWRTSALSAGLTCAAALAGCTQASEEAPPGVDLYASHCASCHGSIGEGDGPVASVMQVTVPNLRSLTARSGGVFPADAVAGYVDGRRLPVSHGDRQMPVWGDVFQPEDGGNTEDIVSRRIGSIVAFIEEIQYR